MTKEIQPEDEIAAMLLEGSKYAPDRIYHSLRIGNLVGGISRVYEIDDPHIVEKLGSANDPYELFDVIRRRFGRDEKELGDFYSAALKRNSGRVVPFSWVLGSKSVACLENAVFLQLWAQLRGMESFLISGIVEKIDGVFENRGKINLHAWNVIFPGDGAYVADLSFEIRDPSSCKCGPYIARILSMCWDTGVFDVNPCAGVRYVL